MIPRSLVLATANRGKIAELRALVDEWRAEVEVCTLTDYPGVVLPEENGTTYADNAAVKARTIAAATGLAALADDSGLEVDALGGAPGVRSARYAGADADDATRVAKLLSALRDVPARERKARFQCVVVLAWPDGREERAVGECSGQIATEPRGLGGFGYDPIFVSDELGMTLAEASPGAKQQISHRARAMRALGHRLSVA